MDRARVGRWSLALCLVAAPVVAQDATKGDTKPDELVTTIKSIEESVQRGDVAAAQVAFAKAVALKGSDKRDVARLARAVGKGVKHKNPQLVIVSMAALGQIESPGSSTLLGKYMKPPRTLPDEESEAALYLTAVQVAGQIHDAPAQGRLVGLLNHRSEEVGKTAAKALANYRVLEPKERMKLIKRLVKVLESFEKKLARARVDEETRHRVQTVRGHLITTVGTISRHRAAITANDWKRWLRAEQQRQLRTG